MTGRKVQLFIVSSLLQHSIVLIHRLGSLDILRDFSPANMIISNCKGLAKLEAGVVIQHSAPSQEFQLRVVGLPWIWFWFHDLPVIGLIVVFAWEAYFANTLPTDSGFVFPFPLP